MEKPEEKVSASELLKSSSEILSELFSTFDAEPPLIIKKEEYTKKPKKSKKKHKHKDKKHKRKSKKRKRSRSNSSSSSDEESKLDLAKVLVKRESETPEKKIKLEENTNIKQESANENCTNDNKDLSKEIKIKAEEQDEEGKTKNSEESESKIKIQNLKFSSLFKQTILEIQEKQKTDPLNSNVNQEITDISDLSEDEVKRSKKHKHKMKHSHKSSPEQHKKRHKSENKDKHHRHRSTSSSRNSRHSQDKSSEKGRTDKDRKHSDKDDFYAKHERNFYKDKYREDYKDKYDEKDSSRRYGGSKKEDRKFYKEDDYWGRSYREDYSRKEDKKFSRDRYRGHSDFDKDRDYKQKVRSKSQERDYIDKKKLLEIARKNAIQMMRSGSLPAALTLGPQAQEKVLAAIRAGGKTIDELTEFCKTLSKKEELGELSSVSEDENDSDTDRPFHHPFQIKDRPTSIIMNIKNSVPLPTKTSQERSTELRMQFPVSSGQQHRKTENEWVPVSPKKTEAPIVATAAPKPVATPVPPPVVVEEIPKPPVVVQPLPVAAPGPQVFPPPTETPVDIGMIVSQRLSAMRKLQENPNDVQAISEMYRAQKEMQSWAQSKQQPGQFTGSTGAQILSQAELCSGYQAWAKKDQLQTAAPVSGGMGMHLLQKMGWRPGEGLGKEKTGTLEPLLLEVKLNKKGLVATEEQRRKQPVKGNPGPRMSIKSLEGKHPVSLLGEYAAKKKLGPPIYELCNENGPDHKKTFMFKVILNGIEYRPSAPNFNKKHAKKDAAQTCLQMLGLLPPS